MKFYHDGMNIHIVRRMKTHGGWIILFDGEHRTNNAMLARAFPSLENALAVFNDYFGRAQEGL